MARAAYFGLCEYFDRKIGQLLDKLDETGLRDNSDHGEMAGEHGCWWKSNYYEGSVDVPLIARLPGFVPAGVENPVLCNLLDWVPTAVEAAGGHSLWRELQGHADDARPDTAFSELGPSRGASPSRMIRQEPWKLYKYHDDTPPALFNLVDDPGEWNDLGSARACAALRQNLLAQLYAGWNPEQVAQRSAELTRNAQVLTAWGQTVQPLHEDTLPVEDVEDVVLC